MGPFARKDPCLGGHRRKQNGVEEAEPGTEEVCGGEGEKEGEKDRFQHLPHTIH